MIITDEMLAEASYEINEAISEKLAASSECEHVFSPAFEKKMKKLIWKADHYVMYKALKRAACIFIVFLLSASMFLAFNPEARAAIANWVMERYNEFYHYFFVGETEPEETVETDATGTEETYEATTVTEESTTYSLGWIPDGYDLLTSTETGNKGTLFYANNSGQILQFMYIKGADGNSLFAGIGEYEQKYITEGDFQAEILFALESDMTNAITWKDDSGDVMFYISGNLSEDELIKMAQNVVSEKNN